jgi:hypothetical protein
MTDKTDTTILLDIYERLGAIENELRNITKNHDDMEEELKGLKDFKSRVGAYIWLGGLIATGVLSLLYEGIKYGFHKWIGS